VPDARIDALIRFTRAVVHNKGFVPETETAAFLAAGYTKAQVLEVAGQVGLKTLHNYVHALTNAPLDAAFQPQQWSADELKVA
jgi:alkylhydroperoxidase family enzyme